MCSSGIVWIWLANLSSHSNWKYIWKRILYPSLVGLNLPSRSNFCMLTVVFSLLSANSSTKSFCLQAISNYRPYSSRLCAECITYGVSLFVIPSSLCTYFPLRSIVNISLFCDNEQDFKNVAIFCYKIVSEKTDLELASLIVNSDHTKFIRDSPYYSSKAYAYMNDIGSEIYTNDMSLPFFKLRKTI
jgi:hypothetical protein